MKWTIAFGPLVILFTFFITTSLGQGMDSLDWKSTIKNHTYWTASIEKHRPSTYASVKGVKIILEKSTLKISDFTGGLFSYYNDSNPYPVEILVDDSTGLLPLEIMTIYGPCKINGHWDPVQNALKIHWTIEFNKIKEVTTFTLN